MEGKSGLGIHVQGAGKRGGGFDQGLRGGERVAHCGLWGRSGHLRDVRSHFL